VLHSGFSNLDLQPCRESGHFLYPTRLTKSVDREHPGLEERVGCDFNGMSYPSRVRKSDEASARRHARKNTLNIRFIFVLDIFI
jgi:hypothetical protein